jgi:hypothetical protein
MYMYTVTAVITDGLSEPLGHSASWYMYMYTVTAVITDGLSEPLGHSASWYSYYSCDCSLYMYIYQEALWPSDSLNPSVITAVTTCTYIKRHCGLVVVPLDICTCTQSQL